jgi:hypothetical protein
MGMLVYGVCAGERSPSEAFPPPMRLNVIVHVSGETPLGLHIYCDSSFG